MKKLILIFLALLLFFDLFFFQENQKKSITSIEDTIIENACISVVNELNTFVQVGVDNIFRLKYFDGDTSNLKFETEKGILNNYWHDYPETFIFHSVKDTGKFQIKAIYKDKIIYNESFTSCDYWYIVAKVGGETGGKISKNVLLAQFFVKAEAYYTDFDITFIVKNFKMVCYVDSQKFEETVTGATISKTQKEMVAKLKTGDFVFFQDIIAVGPTHIIFELEPIIFEIK